MFHRYDGSAPLQRESQNSNLINSVDRCRTMTLIRRTGHIRCSRYDMRYEIEEYTVQECDHQIDEYPNDRLPFLANTATVNVSACAPYRTALLLSIDSRADHIETILTVRGDPLR